MKTIIETKNLAKLFTVGKKTLAAVNGLTMSIAQGEIFGLLGTNGAGKTTTIRMLTTLLRPTSGTALVVGYDIVQSPELVRNYIGYVGQYGGLERSATARENLVLQGQLYGMNYQQAVQRAQELIEAFGMTSYADRLVKDYSGGQRRKVDIALGVVHKPHVVFLDEPTVGLDPQSRALLWQEIKELKSQGTTVILTTHYLDEADALCDRVAIVDGGNIVALGSPAELKRSIACDSLIFSLAPELLDTLNEQALFAHVEGVKRVVKQKEQIHLDVQHGEKVMPAVLETFHKAGIIYTSCALRKPTLDDVFLLKTGHYLSQ